MISTLSDGYEVDHNPYISAGIDNHLTFEEGSLALELTNTVNSMASGLKITMKTGVKILATDILQVSVPNEVADKIIKNAFDINCVNHNCSYQAGKILITDFKGDYEESVTVKGLYNPISTK